MDTRIFFKIGNTPDTQHQISVLAILSPNRTSYRYRQNKISPTWSYIEAVEKVARIKYRQRGPIEAAGKARQNKISPTWSHIEAAEKKSPE
ncbi:hypothetical protein AVEN_52633-1 [Araneus ventricosus]|uniref:Uncharacterized protein n=1 Tax=Araneus ventricosus TaxID=182803 RepID=A0A4Y2SF00_ARAVE|nr:hypothetical protein AVEN_52633-1 [Araneus ventricosus]